MIFLISRTVTHRCMEDEGTGKEAPRSPRQTGRSSSQSTQGLAEEGTKSDTRIERIPKPQRCRLNVVIDIVVQLLLQIYMYTSVLNRIYQHMIFKLLSIVIESPDLRLLRPKYYMQLNIMMRHLPFSP